MNSISGWRARSAAPSSIWAAAPAGWPAASPPRGSRWSGPTRPRAEADTGIVAIAQHCRSWISAWTGGLARIGRSRIRFIERDHLAGLLARAGLVAAARYGDWHRGAFTPTSKEIIAVTRRAG